MEFLPRGWTEGCGYFNSFWGTTQDLWMTSHYSFQKIWQDMNKHKRLIKQTDKLDRVQVKGDGYPNKNYRLKYSDIPEQSFKPDF